MVKEQRLWRGIYRKRQFVTLFVLRKLTIAWFTTALRQGTLGFDVSLGRVLPLILMMAIDCRVCDIVACDTQHAKAGMYMRHEDIYLTLDDEGDEVSNVVADVTMKYEKGKKLSHDNRCRRVEQFRKSFATQQNYQQHRESCLWRQIKAAEDAAAGVKKEKKRVEPPKDTACPHAGPGPDDCKAGPFKKSNLAAHLETHEFQEKSRCPRENCPSERVFPKLVDWRLHLLEEHKGQKKLPEPVICELCNEVWTTAQAYNQHLKFKHSFKGKKLAMQRWR
ncbi:hypothetical protein LTR67_006319 [Exophiala xenobiotica]